MMIGMWQKFGEGEPPQDGEALVFMEYGSDDVLAYLEGAAPGRLNIALHRCGTLHTMDRSTVPIPYGCWWTSLPPAPGR